MKINTSIAAIALAASGTSSALVPAPLETKTICLSSYELNDGSILANSCNQAANNEELQLEILENGCAEGQIALTATRWNQDQPWSIEIGNCLPPNVAQL